MAREIPQVQLLMEKHGHSAGGDDTVGNPRRAQNVQFELFKLTLLSKLDERFPVEQLEPTVSQSTVSSPLLRTD